MRILRILIVVVLLGVGAGAVYIAVAGPPGSGSQATRYLTAAVTRRTVSSDVAADGNITSGRVYSLAFGSAPSVGTSSTSASNSSSSGGSGSTWHVSTVDAVLGAAVKKGDTLATASSPDLVQQVSAATSQMNAATVSLSQAQDNYDNATSGNRDQMRIALYQARASASSARQNVASLKDELAHATLSAPGDGIVTAVNVVAGIDAPTGAAITIDGTPLQVTADVTELDVTALSVGQPTSVVVAATGDTIDGTVNAIAPASTSSSGSVVTFAVTIDLANPPSAVRPGMSAQVAVTTAQAANVLAVPTSALQGTAGQYTVAVLDSDGQPVSEAVTVGLIADRYAEVQSGLNEGQQVVIGTVSNRTSTTSTSNGGGLNVPGLGGGRGTLGGGGNFGGGNRIVTQP